MTPSSRRLAPADSGYEVPVQPLEAAMARFELIYEAHWRDVYRYALGLTQSHEDAEEIASETFERAYRSWSGGIPERPAAWLLLTARRIATDRWRRARRALAAAVGRSGAADGVDQRRTEFWLWFAAVSRVLSDRQREVLLLRYQQDLSDDDIAAVMGLTRSGVRSLVARALDVLRAHPELLE